MPVSNASVELCRNCSKQSDCAPTALLLVSLMHTLYGTLGQEPDYFRNTRLEDLEEKDEKVLNSKISEEDYKERQEGREEVMEDDPELYDFIIVGGGTAGCVLASRLSENTQLRILLLEAGIEEPKITLIPGYSTELNNSPLDWKYSMRPKSGFCQNRGQKGCKIIQGRTLGGTSSLNNMAYIRGNAEDYDSWTSEGNEGWNFNNVLPYFKYSEGNYDKDIYHNKFYHSVQGPLDIGRFPYVDENVDVILNALNELGYNYTDINGKSQLGFMRLQTMSYYGERVSTYTAYIEPIRDVRSNLEIITEALVIKIVIEKVAKIATAKGVVFLKEGNKKLVLASKEVIICAGAINSPKLLMQSGIGHRNYLEYLNIDVMMNLPVGTNFHDHVSVCLPIIKLEKTQTKTDFVGKLNDISKYYKKTNGPLSANVQVAAFLQTSLSDTLSAPDIELKFKGYKSLVYYDRMDVCVTLLTPSSFGHIILNATDPVFGKPLIYPNFLKDESDLTKIYNGITEMIKIFDTKIFKVAGFEFDPSLILDNKCKNFESVSPQFWFCIIRYFSEPGHNYVGTCKMGPATDPGAVVDSKLRVHGVSKLRVVDASIIPKITRGSTAAPVIMIAEKASDIIKNAWY